LGQQGGENRRGQQTTATGKNNRQEQHTRTTYKRQVHHLTEIQLWQTKRSQSHQPPSVSFRHPQSPSVFSSLQSPPVSFLTSRVQWALSHFSLLRVRGAIEVAQARPQHDGHAPNAKVLLGLDYRQASSRVSEQKESSRMGQWQDKQQGEQQKSRKSHSMPVKHSHLDEQPSWTAIVTDSHRGHVQGLPSVPTVYSKSTRMQPE